MLIRSIVAATNITACKRHEIRPSGLGSAVQGTIQSLLQRSELTLEDQPRHNAVEEKIDQGQRRYPLNLIREKVLATSDSTISINVLVMNLEKLQELLFVLFRVLLTRNKQQLHARQGGLDITNLTRRGWCCLISPYPPSWEDWLMLLGALTF